MKNIAFFITHATLTKDHAEICMYSLSKQVIINGKKFDKLYIYNTHEDELSNSQLLQLYKLFDLQKFFSEISVFNYDNKTPKSLGADVKLISDYVTKHYSKDDRVLFLKSDCVLSINYFDEILNLPEKSVYFVAPFINAKQRISNNDIINYSERQTYISSDEITFLVEDQTNDGKNDFNNRNDVSVTDQQIKFTSCYVITDYSCHFISVDLLEKITIEHLTWGGAKFYNLIPYFVGTNRCFVVHKYHGIISENRSGDREGPTKDWLIS